MKGSSFNLGTRTGFCRRPRMGDFGLDDSRVVTTNEGHHRFLLHPLHRQVQDHHSLQVHLQQFKESLSGHTIFMFFQFHYKYSQWEQQGGTNICRVIISKKRKTIRFILLVLSTNGYVVIERFPPSPNRSALNGTLSLS